MIQNDSIRNFQKIFSRYFTPEKEELILIIKTSLALGFMFAFSFMLYTGKENFLDNFFVFSIFLLVLFYTRNIITKMMAYINGFKLSYKKAFFNRYGFMEYDKLTYHKEHKLFIKAGKNVGFELYLVSLFIYFVSAFTVILPLTWRYKTELIKHKFIGTKQKYDKGFYYYLLPQDITRYRYGKTLFIAYLFYPIIGFFLKGLYCSTQNNLFLELIFILYYIAIITIIPILGTEGYEVYVHSRSAWFCVTTLVLVSLVTITLFTSVLDMITFTAIGFVILLLFAFWKELLLP